MVRVTRFTFWDLLPVTADKQATLEELTHLESLARKAGISEVLREGSDTVFGRRP